MTRTCSKSKLREEGRGLHLNRLSSRYSMLCCWYWRFACGGVRGWGCGWWKKSRTSPYLQCFLLLSGWELYMGSSRVRCLRLSSHWTRWENGWRTRRSYWLIRWTLSCSNSWKGLWNATLKKKRSSWGIVTRVVRKGVDWHPKFTS